MKLAFIGTGYVGLVSGVMLSHLGHDVTCIDLVQEKINQLKQNLSPIYEHSLEKYIEKCATAHKLHFNCGYDKKLADQDAVFITVGTPPKSDGHADLSYVYAALDQLLEFISENCVIVLKSTVPPGTSRQMQEYIAKKGRGNKVASNPEFLREGSAVYDFLNPERIVIGAGSDLAFTCMRAIYKRFDDQGVPIVETDFTTSEMIKYASNTFLANKIAFINEMADLCEKMGANVKELSHAIGLDSRIGAAFLKAGPGFGGSCFPKDILALQALTKQVGSQSLILDAIIEANSKRPGVIIEKIEKIVGTLAGKLVAVYGLTYKAGTDDLRSSPAIELIAKLKAKGAQIQAYDPMGNENAAAVLAPEEICADAYLATEGADFAICATEWPEFKDLDFGRIYNNLNQPVLIDLRNFLDHKKVENAGISCYVVGLNLSKSD